MGQEALLEWWELCFQPPKPEDNLNYLVRAPQIKASGVSSGISGLEEIDLRTACLANRTWLLIACSRTEKRSR